MACDLVSRLKAVLVELQAEGNLELAARVEGAIIELERAAAPRPMPQRLEARNRPLL